MPSNRQRTLSVNEYNQAVIGTRDGTSQSTSTENRQLSRETTNRQNGTQSKTGTEHGTDRATGGNTVTSRGTDVTTTDATNERVAESARNLSSASEQTSRTRGRVNIGMLVSFSVSIRGGFPTSSSTPSC